MAQEFVARNGIISKNDTLVQGGLTANTISATTYYNMPSFSGGTITSATNFTGGLSATTISATSITANNILGTTNYVSKFTAANSLGNSLIYDNGTNVGIGTTSPQANLHINSSGNVSYLHLTNTVSGPGSNDGMTIGINTSNYFMYVREASPLYFATDSTERMRITSTGNVGIGTSSPTFKLDIVNTTSNILKLTATGEASLEAGIEFSSPPSDSTLGLRSGRIYTKFDGASFTNSRLTIQSITSSNVLVDTLTAKNGNVGIGTTSPTEKLHVVGNGLFTGTLEVDTVNNGAGDFITRTAGGILTRRTAAEVRTDIGAQAAGAYIPSRSGIIQSGGIVDTTSLFPFSITTAQTAIGFEYNILLNAVKKGYTFTQSGTGQITNPAGLCDGFMQPNYSNDGINPADPFVLLIEGLPGTHTQTGGVFGWTCRYWVPTIYKVEAFDTYLNFGWKTLIYQQTTLATKDLVIPIYQAGLSGQFTKFRITIYDSNGNTGANGFKRWGISEIFFIHPEAQSTHQFLDVEWAKKLSTDRTLTIGSTGKAFNGSANVSWSLAEIGAQAILTNPVTGTGTANYIPKFTSGTAIGNSLVYDNGTNVGIGTTNPAYKLEINGGPISIINGYSEPGVETGYRLKFADNGGIANDSGIGLSGALGSESLWINKGSANGNIRFMFGTLGEKVTFTSAGNVGIGTTIPLATLHVSGNTLINGNLTATTISATTYLNLPLSATTNTFVTANTFNNATYDLTLTRNDGTSLTSNLGLLSTDVKVTGGTYNINTGVVTFTNTTGGTFNVTGFSSGMTDTFTTGGTVSSGTATFTKSNGGTYSVSGFNTGTVTNVSALTLGTTGTDLSSTVANGTTTPVITLNVPTASATNRGVLSTTDWTTFNTKQTALNGTGFVKIVGTTISYDNSTYYLASNPSGYTTGSGTANYIPKFTGTSALGNSVIYDNGTNVGIGTTTPSTKLQVAGTITSTGTLTAYTSVPSINIGHNGSSAFIAATSGGGGNSDITFSVGNNAERMRITSSGNILIGTPTDNGGKLQIKAPGALSTDIALRVRNSADTGDLMTMDGFGKLQINTTTNLAVISIFSSGNASRLQFQSSAYNNIQANGAVPFYFDFGENLNFRGSVGGSQIMRLVGSTSNVLINTTTDNGGKLQIKAPGALSTDIALRVRNSADTGDLMTVNGIGNVGIGTTSPAEKLEVSGDVKTTNALLSNQQNTSIGVGTSTVFTKAVGSYTAAFFDYVVTSGANARAGTVFMVINGSSVEFAETETNSIGSTTALTLVPSLSGGNILLRATSTSGTWSVKVLARVL